jgi:hypothetical protein
MKATPRVFIDGERQPTYSTDAAFELGRRR